MMIHSSVIARLLRALLLASAALMPLSLATAQDTKPRSGSDTTAAAASQNVAEVQEAIGLFREGDLVGALEKLEAAVEAHPELPPAKLMLARLLLAANQVPTGRALLEDVAAENPAFPVTYILFGNIALAEGRISDAQLNYLKARENIDAARIAEDQKTDVRVEVVSGLAAVAERRSDWMTARSILEELVSMKPDDGSAKQRFARALFNLDQREAAIEQLRAAVRNDPALDPPGITIGWLLADKGDWDGALKAMQEAVAQDPESPSARLGLATLLMQREQPKEAREQVNEALKQAPDSLPAQRLLGAAAYRLKDFNTAEKQLRIVLDSAPDDVASHNLLVLVLADQGDAENLKQAVELAEMNIQRSGQNPQTLATLGWAYYRGGRPEAAFEVLQAATNNGQASPDIAYYMACVLADQGQEADAMRLLRSALDAPIGQFAARADAQAKLAELAKSAGQKPVTGTPRAETPQVAPPSAGETVTPKGSTAPRPPGTPPRP